MFKLLRAEFSRAFGSMMFLCGTALCLFMGAMSAFMNTYGNDELFIDDLLFLPYYPVVVLSAVFTSFFIGSEYYCGAFRNKLIIGHKRADVYLTGLITSVTCSLIFNAATMLPWLFAWKRVVIGCSENEFALRILASFCAVAACCSLFVLFSTLITRPWLGTAVTIIAAFLLLSAPANNVSDPPPHDQIMMNVIPSCHLKRLALASHRFDRELDGVAAMPVYSMGALVVSSAIGTAVFSKKNLK